MLVAESVLELAHPTVEDTGNAKFLAKNSPGMHHLWFEIDDIEGMLAVMKEKRVRLNNEKPFALESSKMAFVHAKCATDVLAKRNQPMKIYWIIIQNKIYMTTRKREASFPF